MYILQYLNGGMYIVQCTVLYIVQAYNRKYHLYNGHGNIILVLFIGKNPTVIDKLY
jgi:hypothetical protein